MTGQHANSVLQYIRRMVATDAGDPGTDRQLLERFAGHHDEVAFEALVQRHGPLVWGVCRRVLSDLHDAEDAFQATFLVLVRKAGSIARGELLSNWLYGVAHRVAVRARANAARRRFHEHQTRTGTTQDPLEEAALRDLGPVLDEEVRRLPAKYRVPIILCYLQGKTNEEAAREIGCPKGTVLSRLAQAREQLRVRLTRRGIGLSAGGLVVGLSASAASAAVPPSILDTTIRAGLLAAIGKATIAGSVSPSVATLTQGVLQTMFLTKLIATTVVMLAAAILGTGAGVISYHVAATEAAESDQKPADPVAATKGIARTDLVKVASPQDGVVAFIGTEIKEGEKVPANQIFTIKVEDEVKKFRRLKKGDRVEEGQLLARLDDRVARADYAIKKKKFEEVTADYEGSAAIRDEYKARWDIQVRLMGRNPGTGGGTTSKEDERLARVQWMKALYEAETKKKATEGTKLELKKAQAILEMHDIRCRTSGVIQAIAKHPGEGVKSLETVIVLRIADQ